MQKIKIGILYGSTHHTTAKIVKYVSEVLNIESVYDVKNIDDMSIVSQYDWLVFFCPTYGDEELQSDMEDFFQKQELVLTDKKFTICETGNYYGYDDFTFGAGKILEYEMEKHGCRQLYKNLSLDTLPRIDWEYLNEWLDGLKEYIQDER